jgi:hypothetical protein
LIVVIFICVVVKKKAATTAMVASTMPSSNTTQVMGGGQAGAQPFNPYQPAKPLPPNFGMQPQGFPSGNTNFSPSPMMFNPPPSQPYQMNPGPPVFSSNPGQSGAGPNYSLPPGFLQA